MNLIDLTPYKIVICNEYEGWLRHTEYAYYFVATYVKIGLTVHSGVHIISTDLD